MKRFVFVGLLAAMAACSPERGPGDLVDPQAEGTLVLDAVLIVDRPFPRIVLSRALSPVEAFTAERAAEAGAEISITSAGVEVADYADVPGSPGEYLPASPWERVLPETTYEILVRAADGAIVTGTTHTPPRFRVNDWLLLEDDAVTERLRFATFADGPGIYSDPRNRVRYGDGLLEARFDRPAVVAFQVAILNLESDSPLVVEPDFFSDEDLADLDRFLSSPPIVSPDGLLRLPWLAVYYAGRTLIRIHAIDDNWYDLIRSTPGLDSGGSGLAFGGNAGEGFELPLFRLQGGIGLFGSSSVDSGGFTVLPAE